MYLLLCKPIVVIPQNTLSARECRIVHTRPTQQENKLEVELLDAPPINVDNQEIYQSDSISIVSAVT
jgi:hypothetical protein